MFQTQSGYTATYRRSITTTAPESVVIPKGFSRIGESAFSNYVNLKSIKLPESLEHIGYRAFSGCGLGSVVIERF
ncbi:MAG: leucine-rich repeat domain-containing protein [Pseudomonadota bacterium]|nr:leucine-rich repeat domain-containing protein [Pseudomonadota bacterium]